MLPWFLGCNFSPSFFGLGVIYRGVLQRNLLRDKSRRYNVEPGIYRNGDI